MSFFSKYRDDEAVVIDCGGDGHNRCRETTNHLSCDDGEIFPIREFDIVQTFDWDDDIGSDCGFIDAVGTGG